jgi:hypothetical protein
MNYSMEHAFFAPLHRCTSWGPPAQPVCRPGQRDWQTGNGAMQTLPQNETCRPYAAVWCAAFPALENGGIADRSSSSLFTNGGNYSQCQVGRSTWNVVYTCQRSIMLDPEVILRRSAKHRGKIRGDFAPGRDGASGALRLQEVTGNQAATTLGRRADRAFAPLDPPSFPMLPRSVFFFFSLLHPHMNRIRRDAVRDGDEVIHSGS